MRHDTPQGVWYTAYPGDNFVAKSAFGWGVRLLNAFTTGNPFWGQIYLKLVWGEILGL